MKTITNWRSLGFGLALFATAIILPLVLIGQSHAAMWGDKGNEGKSAFIGVYPEELEADDAEALEYKGDGILVEDVVDDGPAEKAGIESGDIITNIDGEAIKGVSEFRSILAKHSPGDNIKVSAIHNKAVKEYAVVLGEREEQEFNFNFEHFGKDKRGFLGVVTESIKGDFADYFGVKEGALIKKVVEDSPAEKAGLKPGDVLTEIDDEGIEDTEDVVEVMQDHNPGDKVAVKYIRQGKKSAVDVTLAEAPGSSWNVKSDDSHRIVISDDKQIIIDTEELHKAIKEVLKDVQIKMNDGSEDLHKEMERLKVELEQLKKEMEARRNDSKDKSGK